MNVADLSPGTELVAGATGWTYRVQGDDGDRVVLVGPHGSIAADRDEIQRDIARGAIQVVN